MIVAVLGIALPSLTYLLIASLWLLKVAQRLMTGLRSPIRIGDEPAGESLRTHDGELSTGDRVGQGRAYGRIVAGE